MFFSFSTSETCSVAWYRKLEAIFSSRCHLLSDLTALIRYGLAPDKPLQSLAPLPWEMTDLWTSRILVLECIYLLLFLFMLLCPLSGYMFPLQEPCAKHEDLFLGHNSVRHIIFPAEADNSIPFAPKHFQESSYGLKSFYGPKHLLWSFACDLSFGVFLSFTKILIEIWILCILLLLTTNIIFLCLNLIILLKFLPSNPFQTNAFLLYYKLLSGQSFPNFSVLLLKKYFTSWHN